MPSPQRSDDERSETERSGGLGIADRGGVSPPAPVAAGSPEPEVLDRARRRRFTATYKRRIVQLADTCGHGQVAALLRREGLYSSHLAVWRKQLERGGVAALEPMRRGPKVDPGAALQAENERLRKLNQRLEHRLRQAETVIEVQKKVSELLGIPLNTPPNGENA